MAKQIILTQNNFGIPVELQFMSNTNSPVDLTDKTVEVAISYDGIVIDVLQATISSYTNGTAYIIVNTKHTSNVGLYTSYWSVKDKYGYITAQEDLYYYVKEEYNGAENNGIEQDKGTIEEEFDKVNSSIETINSQLDKTENKIKNLSIINVKDFGAIGGGVETSEIDQKAFEEAIKHLKTITSSGDDQTGLCELFIPHGRYYVGGFEIPCGVKIRGAGMWNTMLFHNKDSYLIKIIGDEEQPATMITDLNIRDGYHHNADYSLRFESRTAVVVKNCWFGANKSVIFEGTFDSMITNCIFDMPINGIKILNTGNIIVSNNIFWGVKSETLIINNSKNISISSNQFIRCDKDNIMVNNVKDIILANNIFESYDNTNNAGHNIKINSSTNFIVNSNIMKECRCNGICIDSDSKFGKIINNIINFNENNSASGIMLLDCSNIDVVNNNIHNAFSYDLVSRGSDIKIVGNYIDTVLDKTNKGLISGSCAITITGNNNVLDDNKVLSNKNYEFALYVVDNVTVNIKSNDFGLGSNYSNSYNVVQTTAGTDVKNYNYVNPQPFTTTGTTDLITLRDYVNSLVNSLISAGVLEN